MKDLKTLLIELDEVQRKLYRIQNDPQYIEERAKAIFKDKPRRDYTAEIENILNQF